MVAAPWYVYAADAEHPLLNASRFQQQVQIGYIQVLTRYFRYQRSLSSFLIQFYTVVFVQRVDVVAAPWYVYADNAEHPLLNASLFPQRVEISCIQVLTRYFRYQ